MAIDYKGEVRIRRSPADVWAFLLDPDQVGWCLPDLQTLQVQDSNQFEATVRIGVGPVRGPFQLRVTLEPGEDDATAGMSLHGQGLGSALDLTSAMVLAPDNEAEEDAGAAGSTAAGAGPVARPTARPATRPNGTRLAWQARGSVSGPLATVGARLLDGQARKVAERLFENIRQRLEEGAPSEAAAGKG